MQWLRLAARAGPPTPGSLLWEDCLGAGGLEKEGPEEEDSSHQGSNHENSGQETQQQQEEEREEGEVQGPLPRSEAPGSPPSSCLLRPLRIPPRSPCKPAALALSPPGSPRAIRSPPRFPHARVAAAAGGRQAPPPPPRKAPAARRLRLGSYTGEEEEVEEEGDQSDEEWAAAAEAAWPRPTGRQHTALAAEGAACDAPSLPPAAGASGSAAAAASAAGKPAPGGGRFVQLAYLQAQRQFLEASDTSAHEGGRVPLESCCAALRHAALRCTVCGCACLQPAHRGAWAHVLLRLQLPAFAVR